MTDSIAQFVERVHAFQTFMATERVPPAGSASVADAVAYARSRGWELPTDLLDLWRLADGVTVKGSAIWPVDGSGLTFDTYDFREQNENLREFAGDVCAVEGADDVDLYVFRPSTAEWEVVDPLDLTTVFESYPSFVALLDETVGARLSDLGL